MIRVEVDRCDNRFIITAEGHAGAAPKGRDLVCAASSILVYTLLDAVRGMDESGEVARLYHSLSTGAFELDFTAKDFAAEKAEALCDAFTGGFLMLEEHYPGCVAVY